MEIPVGFRFNPTDEEILEHYLSTKNLGGPDLRHIDKVIRVLNVFNVDPPVLPSKSLLESRDQEWYFFCRTNRRVKRQNRMTNSGYWKKTGLTMDIWRNRGNREKIGEKKVFVFKSTESKPKSDWVMHEYADTFLPTPSDEMTYTLCKVMFRGEPSDLPSSSAAAAGGGVEHNHTLITHVNNFGGPQGLHNPSQFNGSTDVEKEKQIDDAIGWAIETVPTPDFNCFVDYYDDLEQELGNNTMFMKENRNDYRPSDLVSATTVSRTSLDASKEKYDDVQGSEMGEYYKMDQDVINNKIAGFCLQDHTKLHQENPATSPKKNVI